jgi:poly(3-hydroxybutyrate) depolymerase
MKFWNRLNETKTHEVIKVSDKTMAHIYSNGVNDIEVWHYKISDFGHWLPGKRATGINAFEVIGEFFSKY